MLSDSASEGLEASIKMAAAVPGRLGWGWEIGVHAHPPGRGQETPVPHQELLKCPASLQRASPRARDLREQAGPRNDLVSPSVILPLSPPPSNSVCPTLLGSSSPSLAAPSPPPAAPMLRVNPASPFPSLPQCLPAQPGLPRALKGRDRHPCVPSISSGAGLW